MTPDEQGEIEELCLRIREEQDPSKLVDLIKELNQLLETRIENARSQNKKKPES